LNITDRIADFIDDLQVIRDFMYICLEGEKQYVAGRIKDLPGHIVIKL